MEHQGLKAFFAVALGVALGILVGRALHPAFGWIVGACTGGVVGYLAVAPIAAIRAIPRAWHTVVERWPSAMFWECARWTVYVTVNMTLSVMLPLGVLVDAPNPGSIVNWTGSELIAIAFLLLAFAVLGAPLWVSAIVNEFVIGRQDVAHQRVLDDYAQFVRWFAIRALPFVVLCYWFPRAMWWFATRGIPASGRFMARFAVTWFRLVHSDLRLLCLADAFLFAGIGTIFGGHVLGWAIAGGTFGALNYEVVSKRVLKLVPVAVRKDE